MAEEVTLGFDPPPLQSNDDIYGFRATAPSQRPRPWDRIPKSPFAAHPRGRKVWKRYELQAQQPVLELQRKDTPGSEELELSNAARAVKRLRIQEMQFRHGEVQDQEPATHYIATLHDRAAGTPRRKYATRRSLRPDRLRSQVPGKSDRLEDANSLPATPPPRHLVDDKVAQSKESLSLENSDEFQEPGDLEDEAAASFTQVDNTKVIIQSRTAPEVKTLCMHEENTRTVSTPHSHGDGNVNPRSWDEVNSEKINSPSPEAGVSVGSLLTPKISLDSWPIMQIEHPDGDIDAPSSDREDLAIPRTEDMVDPLEDSEATTPNDERTAVIPVTMTSPAKIAAQEIRPSLLMDGWDTLEIIAPKTQKQPVLATPLNPDDSMFHLSVMLEHVSGVEETPLSQTAIKERRTSQQSIFGGPETDQRGCSVPENENVIIDSLEVNPKATSVHSGSAGDDTDDSSSTGSSSVGEDHHIHEESRQFYDPSEGEVLEFIINEADHVPKDEDGATDGGELDTNTANTEATEISEAVSKPMKGPVRQTRSAARFSDDTSLLQDFLSRAQASKAAKDVTEDFKVPVYIPAPIPSPRRSPRKALAEKDRNFPSPQKPKPKPRDLANRPGTPPGKPTLEAIDLDDADDATASKSCRRSTRKRLFAPPKAAAGAPSCIPVRRPDGTEPIVLQKSQAQELANITRANTRRNKGQSKPPKLMLKSLPAESAGDMTAGNMTAALVGRSDARAVGWDETLVYYQDRSPGKEGKAKEETRPKVRRLRNLGAMNGTPAPKKLVAAADSSNGASAPKRRSRSKSKVPGK